MHDPFYILNPAHKILAYLNDFEDGRLIDANVEMLFKNLKSNFSKSAGAIGFISSIQTDNIFISKHKIIESQSIEYWLFKAHSMWNIAFQLGEYLAPSTFIKNKTSFSFLKESLESKQQEYPYFALPEAGSINALMDNVIHGRWSLKSYFSHNRLSFQAYDNEVEEMIPWNGLYCTNGRPIVFADHYFCFHTVLLHHLLNDYFNYLLFCITGKADSDDNNGDELFSANDRPSKHWLLNDFLELERIFNKMEKETTDKIPFPMFAGKSYFM